MSCVARVLSMLKVQSPHDSLGALGDEAQSLVVLDRGPYGRVHDLPRKEFFDLVQAEGGVALPKDHLDHVQRVQGGPLAVHPWRHRGGPHRMRKGDGVYGSL